MKNTSSFDFDSSVQIIFLRGSSKTKFHDVLSSLNKTDVIFLSPSEKTDQSRSFKTMLINICLRESFNLLYLSVCSLKLIPNLFLRIKHMQIIFTTL